MKTTAKIIIAALIAVVAGCSTQKTDFSLDGETRITGFSLDSYEGEINHKAGSVLVRIPADYDASSMEITRLSLSEGAVADLKEGDFINGNYPQVITVTNGNVYMGYDVTVKHDRAEILSLTLAGKYRGSIDGTSINVFVPYGEDVTAMSVSYTVSDGTSVDVAEGSVLDFSEPVKFTATCRTSVVEYMVTVQQNDLSMEPKAFIGNKATVAELGDEARAAAVWAMSNIPNMAYVYLEDVKSGAAKLGDYKMIWCHFDWTDWPSVMWDTRDIFYAYYLSGGNFLASRDGARYINDVWRIALDQQSPNNMFGGEGNETLSAPSGFSCRGYESHDLYVDVDMDENSVVLLKDAGCNTTNRTLQWGVDWDPYGSLDGWKAMTGAQPLASTQEYDVNRVTIAEFTPREASGMISGTVITIGTPSYEWYDRNNAENKYFGNMEQLTKNAINYLCK